MLFWSSSNVINLSIRWKCDLSYPSLKTKPVILVPFKLVRIQSWVWRKFDEGSRKHSGSALTIPYLSWQKHLRAARMTPVNLNVSQILFLPEILISCHELPKLPARFISSMARALEISWAINFLIFYNLLAHKFLALRPLHIL